MIVNSILKMSEANGPGKRGVVWVQGCSRHCQGCFNKKTWQYFGGVDMSASSILKEFKLKEIDGITISGGEPFDQVSELKELLQMAKKKNLNTLVYSGYTYKELLINAKDVLRLCDYLVDGPYKQEIPSKCRWAGSGNQRFLELENGLIKNDLTECEEYSQTAEITINNEGDITITGFMNI